MKINFRDTLIAIGISSLPVTAALAESPEQLDQLEPGAGDWQVEYYGQFGTTDDTERGHALEVFYGVSDSVALGVEVEGEAEDGEFEVGEFGAMALFTLTEDDNEPVGVGVMFAAAVNDDISLTEAEVRLILEKETENWWAQGNLMLRHVDEDGETGELVAYSWSLQRSIGDDIWLGVEGSGQAFDLGGFDDPEEEGFEASHFAGPSLTAEFELSEDTEVEVGAAYFRRLGDEGAKDTFRVFVQFEF